MNKELKALAVFLVVVTIVVVIILALSSSIHTTKGLKVVDTEWGASTVTIFIQHQGEETLYNVRFFNQNEKFLGEVKAWYKNRVVSLTIYHYEDLYVRIGNDNPIKIYG